MKLRAALLALLLAGPAWAEALPVFAAGGPDAEAYGMSRGYPVGTSSQYNDQSFMVGIYSHADQLAQSHRVARAPTPAPFLRAASELALTYSYQNGSHDLPDYLSRHSATGMLIVRDQTVLFEHYEYGRTDTDRFLSQSMAKTVTSMLIGIALSEGHIRSLDDPASVYVPELAGTEIGATPLHALLHMASGIAFVETYNGTDDGSKLNRLLWGRDSPGAVAAVAQFNTRIAPPDTAWHYAGLNTEVLGLVLARATGMTLAEYLSTRIWQRIGTESDATWITDRGGQEVAYCCFSATLRDWARFGALLAHDGAWNAQQIVPRAWILAATTPTAVGNFLAPGTMTRVYGYGYQVWLLPGERRQFALLGIHGQTILVDPPSKLVLVHTAVRVKPFGDPMSNELLVLWRALVAQEGSSQGSLTAEPSAAVPVYR